MIDYLFFLCYEQMLTHNKVGSVAKSYARIVIGSFIGFNLISVITLSVRLFEKMFHYDSNYKLITGPSAGAILIGCIIFFEIYYYFRCKNNSFLENLEPKHPSKMKNGIIFYSYLILSLFFAGIVTIWLDPKIE